MEIEPVEMEPVAARSPRRARRALAGVAVAALVAGGVTAAVTLGGGDGRPRPLRLLPAGSGAERDGAASDSARYPEQKITFSLAGELPDLGAEGTVYRLVAPDLGADGVAAMASALGIAGTPEPVEGGGWQVRDAEHTLAIAPGGGGWQVSYFASGPDAFKRGGEGSTGSGGGVDPVPAPGDGSEPPPTDTTVVPPDRILPDIQPPEDLPSPEEAERIARALLERMGVLGGDWAVEVTDGGTVGVAVACPEGVECPEAREDTFVTSRSVAFHRVVDGVRANGLDWWIDVGDHSVVQSLYGMHTELAREGEYPLRSTTEVYADLVAGNWWFGEPVPLRDVAALDDAATRPAPDATASGGAPADDPVVTIEPLPGTEPAPPVSEPGTDEPPVSEPPITVPEPEPVVVTITGAARGYLLMPALDGAQHSAYLVPSYRFTGEFAAEGGGPYEAELPALDPQFVEPVTTTTGGTTEPTAPQPTSPPVTEPGTDTTVAPPTTVPVTAGEDTRLEVGVTYAYQLYTHCGARWARFDGRWWNSEAAADPTAVNAPPGWGNPADRGTLVLKDRDVAVYTSSTGESLVFTPRPEAEGEPPPCL